MRYFRYENINKTETKALKGQYAELTKEEKRLACKEKILDTVAVILFFIICAGCFIGCLFLLKKIPISQNAFVAVLETLGIIFLGFAALIFSILLGSIGASPIWDRTAKSYKKRRSKMSQIVLSNACAHLREYYELQEPCIVTKCYESSDKKFKNHDVCIFVVDDELRITVNLKNGFFHGEKDLGCYAFGLEEISLSTKQSEKFTIAAELRADQTVFLLGYRAKAFIEKHFISTENIT